MVRSDRGPGWVSWGPHNYEGFSEHLQSQVQCEKWEADHWMAREDEGAGSFVSCLRRGSTSPRRQTRPGQAPGSGKGQKGQVWGRHAEYWRIQIHCGEWTWVGSLRGLSSWLSGKESACDAEDASDATGSIPGLGKSLGEGHGNPLQYSCFGESHGQSNLVGHSL